MGRSHGAENGRAGEKGQGTLILAGVPIGRAEDASARLAAELARADVVAAEDTRRVRRLAADLNVQISGRVVAYYDVIEARRAQDLIKELEDGKDVLVVTDAGMPGVSDPGYRVVTAAAQAGIRVTAIPGPSALTTALAVSGLPTDRFCFEGFPPRKPGERRRASRNWPLTRAPRSSSSRRAGCTPPCESSARRTARTARRWSAGS